MNQHQPSKSFPISQTSRRDFVKKSSALMVGGAALASGVSIAHGAHAAGDDEIKVALIGCGGRGSLAAAQALKTKGKVTLWAMADAFENRLTQALRKIGREVGDTLGEQEAQQCIQVPKERQFVGLDAYQKAIDSGVDVIVQATPPGFRPLHVEAAIVAGKHVFTEKPLAVDAPGVRRVLAAGELAKEKGLAVGVGLQRHHDPGYMETVKRLQDGAIGEILLTQVYWNSGVLWTRTRADFLKAYDRQPTEMEYQVNNWYYFNWLCGDHIVEQHIHNLDVSNWVKQSHPVSAKGIGGRGLRGKEYGQIFDHHFVEYTYPDGSTMMSQCRHQDGCWSQVDEFAIGSSGTSHVSKAAITAPPWNWEYSGPRVDPYQQEHDDLFAAIRRGESYNEVEYAAHSTMTAIMGRMATYSGKIIGWDEAIASDMDLAPSKYDFESEPPVLPNELGEYPIPVPGKTVVV